MAGGKEAWRLVPRADDGRLMRKVGKSVVVITRWRVGMLHSLPLEEILKRSQAPKG